MSNINIGIDLGTTNSAIAEFVDGKVILHRNPIDFSELLPSVVSFKNNRIIIGNKAKEKLLTDYKSTFSSFKRKMGSESIFQVDDLDEAITPIKLSSLVLKELKSFLIAKEIKAAVITIPASFDTLQSNATKEAGYLAGFEEVVLLQEPIAACIAYSNFQNIDLNEEENWLVYDFGGGTFDVSLAKVSSRELEIIDHKGNNFLGGVDIDQLIIQKIICPSIEKENPTHHMLWEKMISKSEISYTKFYFEILYRVEEIKKELSLREEVYIEIYNLELNINQEIQITRSQFDELISKKFEISYNLLETLLEDNNLSFETISRIILVGGTTYIPYIRSELSKRTGIFVDSSIDPTTAVAIGAAYFAGSKSTILNKIEKQESITEKKDLKIDWIYENQTNDLEELIVGVFDSYFKGSYRISRLDGGYDSGITNFENKISHFVKLLPKVRNSFKVQILDNQQNKIKEYTLEISHGLYTILGQPLPNDICIELDGDGYTYLEKVFSKNDILPLRKVVYKTISKTILKNSNDKLEINVLEGEVRDAIETNLLIGNLLISGADIPFDLIKGMDVEIIFLISESRDLTVEVSIDSIGFSINQVFSPTYRKVDLERVQNEIKYYIDKVFDKINELDKGSLIYDKLIFQRNRLIELYGSVIENLNNDLTDIKYQIDDEKREIIKKIDSLIGNENLLNIIEKYNEVKNEILPLESKMDNEQKEQFQAIIRTEKQFLSSGNKNLISKKTDDLEKLNTSIYKKSDEYYFETFYLLKHNFNIKMKVINKNYHDEMIEKGEIALREKNVFELKVILTNLISNLDIKAKEEKKLADLSSKLGLE
jgi:molecular chaperone DnaK